MSEQKPEDEILEASLYVANEMNRTIRASFICLLVTNIICFSLTTSIVVGRVNNLTEIVKESVLDIMRMERSK